MMTRKELKMLISEGQAEEALDRLIDITDDAIVPKSNLMSARRGYHQGTLKPEDWLQARSRASDSALYLIDKYFPEDPTDTAEKTTVILDVQKPKTMFKTKVFISYNHADSSQIDAIQAALTEDGFEVLRDRDEMEAGEGIQDFIDRMIKTKGFVLSVVSRNSLSSGWVGVESNLAHYAQYFEVSRFIPVMIDHALFDDQLVFDVVTNLDAKLKEIEGNIQKSKELRIGYDHFETKRKRLEELRHNLPKIINQLQGTLVVDVSGEKFAAGMKKVIDTMRGA